MTTMTSTWTKWGNVFKSGLSKFCRRQPFKNLNGYGLLSRPMKCIKGCLPQNSLSPLLNIQGYVRRFDTTGLFYQDISNMIKIKLSESCQNFVINKFVLNFAIVIKLSFFQNVSSSFQKGSKKVKLPYLPLNSCGF